MRNSVKTTTPSSAKDYWRTSDQAYRDACYLCGVDDFNVDVAADDGNKKCAAYISEQADSLRIDWFLGDFANAWCNPPFSRKVEFLQKAYSERKRGLICMMLPYEPCTTWWRENIDGKATIVYVPDGRYNFLHPETGKQMSGVPFSAAFIVFTSLVSPTHYVQFKRGIGRDRGMSSHRHCSP
ncbi:DNA N-6-adenine-methyltransferase [Idiomarina xiamenensis]|uniref:Phage N-6-adenine-methyltransferase n=1 Tax=Idiomarina xiamenensis 10-D-4 TaxID=740709 RepID=K2KNG3_9GAMM|nr:DNA N-6-adenine-methyltransferase [Idiomarina xiamenensis]EKE79070.1 hypothetical protein A10D4_13268 [Idiomarina xiamenensis 10-D-4]